MIICYLFYCWSSCNYQIILMLRYSEVIIVDTDEDTDAADNDTEQIAGEHVSLWHCSAQTLIVCHCLSLDNNLIVIRL